MSDPPCITISSSDDEKGLGNTIRRVNLTAAPSVSNEELFRNFLEKCRGTYDGSDMERAISKLWKKYYNADIAYIKSDAFADLINSRMKILPSAPFVQLLAVRDELTFHALSKKGIVKTCEPGTSKKSSSDIELEKHQDPRKLQHLKKLRKALKDCNERIKLLEVEEVEWSDEGDEDSPYIKLSRFKDRFNRIFKKICELEGTPDHAERRYLQKIKFSGTKYPVLNRGIEKFYNKTRIFPDFQDILTAIKKINVDQKLNLKPTELYNTASNAFTELGNHLQRLREYDYYDTFSSYFPPTMVKDPSEQDPELMKKLEENRSKYHNRENELLQKYVEKQEQYNENEDEDESDKDEDDEVEESENTIITNSENFAEEIIDEDELIDGKTNDVEETKLISYDKCDDNGKENNLVDIAEEELINKSNVENNFEERKLINFDKSDDSKNDSDYESQKTNEIQIVDTISLEPNLNNAHDNLDDNNYRDVDYSTNKCESSLRINNNKGTGSSDDVNIPVNKCQEKNFVILPDSHVEEEDLIVNLISDDNNVRKSGDLLIKVDVIDNCEKALFVETESNVESKEGNKNSEDHNIYPFKIILRDIRYDTNILQKYNIRGTNIDNFVEEFDSDKEKYRKRSLDHSDEVIVKKPRMITENLITNGDELREKKSGHSDDDAIMIDDLPAVDNDDICIVHEDLNKNTKNLKLLHKYTKNQCIDIIMKKIGSNNCNKNVVGTIQNSGFNKPLDLEQVVKSITVESDQQQNKTNRKVNWDPEKERKHRQLVRQISNINPCVRPDNSVQVKPSSHPIPKPAVPALASTLPVQKFFQSFNPQATSTPRITQHVPANQRIMEKPILPYHRTPMPQIQKTSTAGMMVLTQSVTTRTFTHQKSALISNRRNVSMQKGLLQETVTTTTTNVQQQLRNSQHTNVQRQYVNRNRQNLQQHLVNRQQTTIQQQMVNSQTIFQVNRQQFSNKVTVHSGAAFKKLNTADPADIITLD